MFDAFYSFVKAIGEDRVMCAGVAFSCAYINHFNVSNIHVGAAAYTARNNILSAATTGMSSDDLDDSDADSDYSVSENNNDSYDGRLHKQDTIPSQIKARCKVP